jgi:hypothetical protein
MHPSCPLLNPSLLIPCLFAPLCPLHCALFQRYAALGALTPPCLLALPWMHGGAAALLTLLQVPFSPTMPPHHCEYARTRSHPRRRITLALFDVLLFLAPVCACVCGVGRS